MFANEVVTALPYYSMPASGQCELYVGHTTDEESCSSLRWILSVEARVLAARVAPLFFSFEKLNYTSPFTDGDLGASICTRSEI